MVLRVGVFFVIFFGFDVWCVCVRRDVTVTVNALFLFCAGDLSGINFGLCEVWLGGGGGISKKFFFFGCKKFIRKKKIIPPPLGPSPAKK